MWFCGLTEEKEMAIRFFVVWAFVAACVFGFTYFVPKTEKKVSLGWAGKVLLSFVIAAILLAIVMVINNFSGV